MLSGMVLIVDHYDSFTYNLAHELGALGADPLVIPYDQVTIARVQALRPTHLVFSPGPGQASTYPETLSLIRAFLGQMPILGVCLGHQALAVALGGQVALAPELVHGKATPMTHDGQGIFAGLESPIWVGRYHSWVVSALPPDFTMTAQTAEGMVMGMRHRSLPVEGIQFHPESILTPQGRQLLARFYS